MSHSITIQLIDPAMDRPLHGWTFEDRELITIGRKDDNDVVLADPYVSRNHARIEFVDGHWQLHTISDQKVYCGGQPYQVLELHNDTKFQLGPRGCMIRFGCIEESKPEMETLRMDLDATPFFQLDTEKVEQEVTKIATGDFFQKLKDLTKDLRGKNP